MVSPDIGTLFMVLVLLSLTLSSALFLISRRLKQYPGPEKWAWSALGTFSSSCLVMLRGIIPDLFTVVLANLLAVLAPALIDMGVRQFLGRPSRKRLSWVVCGLAALLMAAFVYLRPDVGMRVLVYSLAMTILLADAVYTLLRYATPEIKVAHYFSAFSLGMVGLAQLARGVLTFWYDPPQDIYQASLHTSLPLLVVILGHVGAMIGLVMMLSARLALDLQAHVHDLRDEIGIRREAELRLAQEATLDYLTGAANRRKLFTEAGRALAAARRHHRPLAVIMFDLDHFKEVNDRYGHETGDMLLKEVVKLCQQQLRQEDTLARYGGEEFVILLPETDSRQATIIAERLRMGMARLELPTTQGNLNLTCSFGVSELTPDDPNMEQVLQRADQALYRAKQEGRNQVAVWRAEMFARDQVQAAFP